MASLSNLSLLTTTTALEISEYPFAVNGSPSSDAETALEPTLMALKVQISFDDEPGECFPLKPPSTGLRFPLGNVDFMCEQKNRENTRSLNIFATTEQPVEFAYVAQVRIRTGSPDIPVTKVVDKDVFSFSPFARPLVVNINDDKVSNVHIEMRFINKIERVNPKYDVGDVCIVFPEGDPLYTYKSLLAHHSPYMRKLLADVPDGGFVDVSPHNRSDFLAMLNYIYPTRMPIYKNFKELARTGIAFQIDTVVYACSRHFVDYPDCSFEYKLQEAIKLELVPALEDLVYKAYQCGLWTYMINQGYQPDVACGPNVYRKIVCPIILKAKGNRYGQSVLHSPFVAPNLLQLVEEDVWMNSTLVVLGTPFYVNKGVLTIYGNEGFARGANDELIASISQDFRDACIKANTTPGEVVMCLMTSLYPLAPPVPSRFLRACLIFAHNHNMEIVVQELEQSLLMEPPESADRLLENFILAEKFGLDNMLRTHLQRIEGSCQVLATELIELPGFSSLSVDTRDRIVDRVCSGWGLHNCMLVKKHPTKHCMRDVTLVAGGVPRQEGAAPETFHSMDSREIFGSQHEMITHHQVAV